MTTGGIDARLAAWRREGAHHADPVRFARIDALARRAAGENGAVRSLLDARLAELVEAYAAGLASIPGRGGPAHVDASRPARASAAMATLLDHVARQAAAREDAAGGGAPAAGPAALRRLDEVRRACTDARAGSQLRRALGQAPENAGPLNSASLVHRALGMMRDVSPAYLQPFMAYVDTLAWLDDMGIRGPQATGNAPVPAGGKRPRAKGRSRRA